MQLVSFPARQVRTHYRHELRTLTYVTLDAANGGIIRNLNRHGVAVQAVAPLRQQQRVRVRFELRFPRLRVETFGQVSWAHPAGQCGIRFVDLPARTGRQIDEWIFSNLLDMAGRQAANLRPVFGNASPLFAQEENIAEENDGLTISAPAHAPIRFEPGDVPSDQKSTFHEPYGNLAGLHDEPDAQLNWLSRPLSGRTLAWLVDGLLMLAALLLFAFIFLSITHELPPLPLTLGAIVCAAVFVAAAYRALFAAFGGKSLGARLAQAASDLEGETNQAGRFR